MNSYDHILAKSVDNGGTCLRKHLESVAKFIVIAARYVGVDTEVARLGALLHDIGKIGINEGILNKQEKLTLEEEQIVQAHTLIGAALLKKSGVISE